MSDISDELEDLTEKQQVERLKREYEKAGSFVRETASGGLDIVRGGFNVTHFPLELIQNADDEDAENMLFELDEDEKKVYIFDDGGGFDKQGLISVCQQGRSPKDPRQQIGFMGIGFKSIFEISNNVQIHSKDYHFEFDIADEDEDNNLDAVTPHWISDEQPPEPSTTEKSDYTTQIVASIEDESDDVINRIRDALQEDNLSSSVFLFLDSLTEIEVRSRQSELIRRSLSGGRVDNSDEPDGVSEARNLYNNYAEGDSEEFTDGLVQVRRTGDGDSEERWVVFRDIWDIDEDIPRPRLRKNLDTSDLFIAFRIGQDGCLLKLDGSGSVRISPVHSYLPLSELEVDIDFLIHADFDLDASREGIRSNSEWNDRAAKVVREQCLQNVLKMLDDHSEWWRQSHLIIPQSQQGNNLIISTILEKFRREFIEGNNPNEDDSKGYEFIRDRDSQNVVSVENVRNCTKYARDSLSSDEIKTIIDYRPVHPDQKEVLKRLDRDETKTLAEILSENGAPELLERHTDVDETIDWFSDLYRNLAIENGELNITRTVRTALNNRIILIESGKLSKGRSSTRHSKKDWEVFIPAEDGLEDLQFNVASDLLDVVPAEVLTVEDSDYSARELFSDFGADPATPDKMISEALSDEPKDALSDRDCIEILDVVSPDYVADDISAWLTVVNYEQYGTNQLRELAYFCKDGMTVSDCVDWTRNNWNRLNNSEKRASVRLCKTHCAENGDASVEFLQLPTAVGWSRPENLLPSAEFDPDYDFEMIKHQYPDSINTRNLRLIDGSIINEADGWTRFLDYLDIPDETKLDHVVGDVGETFVKNQFEGVLYRRDCGKDFRSDDGRVLIEVKSTKDNIQKKISLTQPQYNTIRETRDDPDADYYVYSVVNALTDPEIRPSRMKGDEILDEIDEVKVDISGFRSR